MLRRRFLLCSAGALGLLAASALPIAAPAPLPKKPPRKPDIQFQNISSLRQNGAIAYEGDWKITGEKPVSGLVLQLEFFDTEGVLLTQQKIQTTIDTLAPGAEKHFAIQGNDVPRAITFRISATDSHGRDLSTEGSGPYAID